MEAHTQTSSMRTGAVIEVVMIIQELTVYPIMIEATLQAP